jgi:hypothetical protein
MRNSETKIIHECNEQKISDNRAIEIKYCREYDDFELYEFMDDAHIHGIIYCPFCGAKLTY